jgi:DNA-binding transcriptional LysR family regulator
MVQSSLSASLLALERELGARLFIRGRRGAELTDAGRAFLEPARATLQDAERARDAVAEVNGLLRGSVRIVTRPLPRSVDVVETIRTFQVQHPRVHVQVLPADARDLAQLLTEGQVDFAITPRTSRLTPAIQFEPLISSPLVLVCPAGHRLAGAREVDLRDVMNETIIDLPREWHARELFDGMVAERGLTRQAGLEIGDWLSLLTTVQRSLGISYGPQACIDRELFTGVEIATLAEAPRWELGVGTRDDALRGGAGRALLDAYRKRCDEQRARSVDAVDSLSSHAGGS